jgi:hypothetical protein
LGISIVRAAKIAGVSHPTLRLYEADPEAVCSKELRGACAELYEHLRALLGREPLRRPGELQANPSPAE